MQPVVFVLAAALLADISPPSGAPQVTLGTPIAHVDGSVTPPVLVLSAEAHNTLKFPVDSITLGVLYAADRAELEKVDPRRAYARESTKKAGRLVQRVSVNVPAGGRAMASLRAAMPQDGEPPTTFVSHVLGYTLADADAATFLELLGTEAAADEWAACAAFGLTGDAADRRAARARWAGNPNLKGDLAEGLLLPIAPKPTQAETFRRVFAVRALGVLGGPAAEDTLAAWRDVPDLCRFDSALQVLRVGRASGSPFETPLSFAVPTTAIHMVDVVNAALDDAQRLDADDMLDEATARALPSGGVHSPAIEPSEAPDPDLDPPWWTQRDAWILLGMGLTVGAAWLLLRQT